MFSIEKTPESGEFRGKKYVVDHDRNVWLEYVSGHGPHPGGAFHLKWGAHSIGFDTDYTEFPDGNYVVETIRNFGNSIDAEMHLGVRQYIFDDPQTRREAEALAAEALVVFGGYYNGMAVPDGRYRIRIGRTSDEYFTLSTFGYEPTIPSESGEL